jgi:hypothetical protein
MGQWKTSVTIRVKIEARTSLQSHANSERRTLCNLSEILLTWALEQLERAGSTERLMGRRIAVPRAANGNYRRLSIEELKERR